MPCLEPVMSKNMFHVQVDSKVAPASTLLVVCSCLSLAHNVSSSNRTWALRTSMGRFVASKAWRKIYLFRLTCF